MMTHETTQLIPGQVGKLKPMNVLSTGSLRIVPHEMSLKGTLKAVSLGTGMKNSGRNALIFNLFSGETTSATLTLWEDAAGGESSAAATVDGNTLELSYGPGKIELPFALRLNRFMLERYPGSTSPSGYKSDVTLIDKEAGVETPFLIFMNNILKYKGYRIFQSSFDQDEKGTILTVNRDPAGMIVTYTGYALLFLFIVLSLINKKSAFRTVTAGAWSSSLRKAVPLIVVLIVLTGFGTLDAQKLIPDKKSADEFGKILVQDQKGRTKPLFTLSNDILRKVTRENKFEGLTPMQVFLGLYLDFDHWKEVPLIRVSNSELQKNLGIKGKMAAFSDLVTFGNGGSYKLGEDVNKAYSKSPGERSKLDKEIMKVDERLNIIYMVYTGGFLRMFPLKDGTHNWGSPEEALKTASGNQDSLYLKNVIPMFVEALQTGNSTSAGKIAASVYDYQNKFAKYDLPSKARTKAESLYYRMMIFERLFPFYATIGIIMLIGLIVMVISGRKSGSVLITGASVLLFAGFLFHTFGLGLRWFISGHSPMSNGYESMIFISWVTLLAGFIFSRRSPFALSATAVLASMTLLVAHMSFMDPEITNLVPVLKSYWLTLHVSVITGSYGFLGLGAILAIISLILMTLSNSSNRERISGTIDELTLITYRTLVLGLYFLTIGTFLGAVWANESWGRYWGWDPKETWSLITIVIYSIVTHSRLIPGMKDVYSFNVLSLFSFSSVLMTYFGVNYYLSGLHSYASGEAAQVPPFVYITLIILVGLSVAAYIKYHKWESANKAAVA
jgi:cytochrome c-type biogenesis protein CcsB